MVKECLERLPARLRGVEAAPSAEELSALPPQLREKWRQRAERAKAEPLAAILATDWLRFSRDGDRAAFEKLYFSRRRRLTHLVGGALVHGAGPYLDAILDTVWAICEESSWCLPAHNSYLRDKPQLPWPDTSRPVVDLFAAETGALLACVAAVLPRELPEPVSSRIFAEVNRRILVPYHTEHFWWMGDGDEPMCNWTTWCTQNVLLCALLLPVPEEERLAVIRAAAVSLDCFLKDYGEDGCCNEGAQYYGHAGLCLFGCLELLSAAAPGAFEPLWREKKIRGIAAYIFHMHVSGPYYVNFADCSPFAGRRGVREYLFACRTGSAAMAEFAARDWEASLDDPDDDGDIARINLWYCLLELREAGRVLARASSEAAPYAGDIFYPSVGVCIARRGEWHLAAKAGCNDDSHNHNDTGSVILYRGGRPLLIDLGVETYSRRTFSAERYQIWTMQSAWHNLPTFGGVLQKDGPQYRAQDVSVSLEGPAASIAMELAAAWPPEARLESFRRAIEFSADGLSVRDVCRGGYREAFLSLMVCEPPRVEGGRVLIGELGAVAFEGLAGPVEIDTVPISDARLRIAWPDTVYRIRAPFGRELAWRVTSFR